MDESGPQNIHREYIGGNVRFEFPRRPLGWGRLFGAALVGFGLLFVWMPGHMAWENLRPVLHGKVEVFSLIFGLFPLLFVIVGCLPMGIGLLIIFGRCRLEWNEGQLWSTELLGPFRWKRRLPRQPISKLEISLATSRSGNGPAKPVENFSGITALFADGTRKPVVWGYPKSWLLDVAGELSTYMDGSSLSAETVKVEVVQRLGGPDEPNDDVLQLPASSLLQLTESLSVIRVKVPPAGLWKGSKGLFFFALLWCGFMAVFTTVFLLPSTVKNGSEVVFYLFIAGFWLIGIFLMTAAFNMGRRTAEISADAGCLRIATKGIFGVKQREWATSEIAAIRAGPSGMEVNDRPVIELQIHPIAGKKAGFLAGRDEQELRWLATRLRQTLKVPAQRI